VVVSQARSGKLEAWSPSRPRVKDTPPRVICEKSSESHENKGVDVFDDDKEFARV
jgi:hypothetical protein